MISNFLQILGIQPLISKVFLITKTIFLTVGQNNFDNKIPFVTEKTNWPLVIFCDFQVYLIGHLDGQLLMEKLEMVLLELVNFSVIKWNIINIHYGSFNLCLLLQLLQLCRAVLLKGVASQLILSTAS